MELDSGAVSAHTVLRWAYEKKGMHPEALAAFDQERVFPGDTATTYLKRAEAVARREDAQSVLKEAIERRPKQWVSAYEIAVVYGWLGDYDKPFAGLRRLNASTQLDSPSCASIRVWKDCARIRDSKNYCAGLIGPYPEFQHVARQRLRRPM
jgi:tetratricopeptide (TPR) repeat protein